MRFRFAVALSCLVVAPSYADDLKIVSWNIANLAQPGQTLRGFERTAQQYTELRTQLEALDADVIAFQEVGSIPALQAILPDGYAFQFETRCLDNATQCTADVEDIFTAIAIRDTIQHAFFQIDQLAIEHQNECGDTPRKVRGAVGVDITHEGSRYLIPSLHIKATCKNNSIEPGTEDDCVTQRKQLMALRTWMDTQDDDAAIVLAGDFNRELLTPSDRIRKEIFPSLTDEAFLPDATSRTCWAEFNFDFDALADEARANNPQFDAQGVRPWMFTPKSSTKIDFFVLEGMPDGVTATAEQLPMTGTYQFRNAGSALTDCDGSLKTFSESDLRVLTFAQAYPSDHCPIALTLGD